MEGKDGSIAKVLSKGKAGPDQVLRKVLRKPALLDGVIDCLAAREARVRFGAAKVLMVLAGRAPTLLSPRLDALVGLLRGNNKILEWTALAAIGDLAAADADRRIDALLDEILARIRGPVLITAANSIVALGKIALARPDLAGRIAAGILAVEEARYATGECRNVAIGKAIETLERFRDRLADPGPVDRFVERQLGNGRAAVRKRAERWMKRVDSRQSTVDSTDGRRRTDDN